MRDRRCDWSRCLSEPIATSLLLLSYVDELFVWKHRPPFDVQWAVWCPPSSMQAPISAFGDFLPPVSQSWSVRVMSHAQSAWFRPCPSRHTMQNLFVMLIEPCFSDRSLSVCFARARFAEIAEIDCRVIHKMRPARCVRPSVSRKRRSKAKSRIPFRGIDERIYSVLINKFTWCVSVSNYRKGDQ
jgi:hypothetical protein